jgi:thiamine-phosphate pyrophosphorylase
MRTPSSAGFPAGILCLITNGRLDTIAQWIAKGVDLVQIRERDLNARQLAEFTRAVLAIPNPHGTKILVNDRSDVAIACDAHGVHLRDGSVPPERFARPGWLITISCHRVNDAPLAAGADYVLLAPIFQPLSKTSTGPALGTEAIREFRRRSPVPVLALGGITAENAGPCLEAGAAGIAGITCFEQ